MPQEENTELRSRQNTANNQKELLRQEMHKLLAKLEHDSCDICAGGRASIERALRNVDELDTALAQTLQKMKLKAQKDAKNPRSGSGLRERSANA